VLEEILRRHAVIENIRAILDGAAGSRGKSRACTVARRKHEIIENIRAILDGAASKSTTRSQ